MHFTVLEKDKSLTPDKWTILVVEDEPDSLETISKILRHNNIRVCISRNGKECLKVIEEVDPTAVIMDLFMPEMDGWETLMHIRSNVSTSRIPVVAVTAYYSASLAEESLKAGFNGYFPKPVSPLLFVNQLTQIISGQ